MLKGASQLRLPTERRWLWQWVSRWPGFSKPQHPTTGLRQRQVLHGKRVRERHSGNSLSLETNNHQHNSYSLPFPLSDNINSDSSTAQALLASPDSPYSKVITPELPSNSSPVKTVIINSPQRADRSSGSAYCRYSIAKTYHYPREEPLKRFPFYLNTGSSVSLIDKTCFERYFKDSEVITSG